MSVDTIARLKGNVSVKEITNLLTEKYHCTINSEVKKSIYGDELAQYVYDYYSDNHEISSMCGFIDLNFPDKHSRSLFYSKSSVNYYENLGYYKELGLENMVTSETTFISLGMNDEAEEIISSIAKHFGGWYFPNDCNDEIYEYYPNVHSETDIDVVVKVTMDDNQMVRRIEAYPFNMKTGKVFSTAAYSDGFNMSFDNCVPGEDYQRCVIRDFGSYLEELSKEYNVEMKNIRIWDNGILFDRTILIHKADVYGYDYLRKCSYRDINTLVEIANTRVPYGTDEDYICSIPKTDSEIRDTINLIIKAYKDVCNS